MSSHAIIDPSDLDPASTLVVATGNPHKVTEIEAILEPVMPHVRFVALGELGDFEDPVEDGDTFTANALIKARTALAECGLSMAVADDSGLVVDALDGAPGIFSARWAGSHGDDAANNEKLLRELEGVPAERRGAHYHASVVLVRAGLPDLVGEGDFHGRIALAPRGDGGFGYDPLFLPDATPGRTLAEVTPEEKNSMSHRFLALHDLAGKLA
ncbi:MAG: RdgB/HAM1 family non-canonical purine NTP pyrophosphatase [Atopobiaceae bacterium]|nr:RdgB/HAM1 family non-canonical purine NTP pyrophosphatase [Atopobiaceae bacterium]MCI2173885.1 RdgB/HAM1 family non-canonical purine NTP pyrophosphatase [Atopobiaceae bacterium]MCI2208025.1 RdgB/HAM1 family non-canonical purine NTP pyrophosphatase [Atopobiaceae bacterium]